MMFALRIQTSMWPHCGVLGRGLIDLLHKGLCVLLIINDFQIPYSRSSKRVDLAGASRAWFDSVIDPSAL